MDGAMTSLRDALQAAGIDTASLRVLCKAPEEKFYGLTVHGSQAVNVWSRLRAHLSETGHWPVLTGEECDVDALQERVHYPHFEPTKRILEGSLEFDGSDWFEERYQDFIDEIEEFGYRPDPTSASEGSEREFYGMPRGVWPEEQPQHHGLHTPRDVLTGRPCEKVHLVLIPSSVCWHVPAYLKFGSWNECPAPEVHAAVMRYWFERYGAEVVSITHDVVEMQVSRPPASKAEGLQLARQQYLYCGDIVDQGTETLDALAATLVGGPSWFFWWD